MIFRYCRGADYYDNILQISAMKIFFYTKSNISMVLGVVLGSKDTTNIFSDYAYLFHTWQKNR